jgi:hypothetical protein
VTRASTTTGQRLGPLGRFSWPLLALLGLLVVLAVASLVSGILGGSDGDDGARAAQASPSTAALVMSQPSTAPDSGMMLPEPSSLLGTTMTEKDV